MKMLFNYYRHWLRVRLSLIIESYPVLHIFCLLVTLNFSHITAYYRKDFELLVEGYPRSSNTYTVYTLLISQKNRVLSRDAPVNVPLSTGIRLRGHSHFSSLVKFAVRNQKPVLLLLRNPVDAIVSWQLSFGEGFEQGAKGDGYDLMDRLDWYIAFHRSILPLKDKICIFDFNLLTSDFKRVVSILNQRYPSLNLFEDFDDAGVNHDVAKEIKLINMNSSGKLNTNSFHLPSQTREERKPMVMRELQSVKYRSKLSQAHRLYELFLETANR